MRRFAIFSALFFIALPCFAASPGISFVSSPLWISDPAPTEGDTVTIYAAIFNGNDGAVKATVSFYDNETVIGDRTLSISANQIGTFSASTKVGAGSHAFHAVIKKALLPDGQDAPGASLGESNVVLPKIFVAKVPIVAQASDSADATNTTGTSPLAAIDTLQDKVSSVIPEGIKDGFSATIGTLDGFRTIASDSVSAKRDELRHESNIRQLEEANIIKSDKSDKTPAQKAEDAANPVTAIGKALRTPWEYIALTFFDILAFILGNKYVFYPVLAVLIFLIIRLVWRRFRG